MVVWKILRAVDWWPYWIAEMRRSPRAERWLALEAGWGRSPVLGAVVARTSTPVVA